MTIQLCPVCRGCGLVPSGFYDPLPMQGTAAVPWRRGDTASEAIEHAYRRSLKQNAAPSALSTPAEGEGQC